MKAGAECFTMQEECVLLSNHGVVIFRIQYSTLSLLRNMGYFICKYAGFWYIFEGMLFFPTKRLSFLSGGWIEFTSTSLTKMLTTPLHPTSIKPQLRYSLGNI